MGRLGLSEEQANAIVFIASDGASFITGHILIWSFPSVDAALAWYQSPAYQEVAVHRFKGSDHRVFVIEGVD
jgi:uncharacterized protein (DUF1330 family)